MNEKFLSRGKREDNGEWVTGYYVKIPDQADKLNKERHIIFELDGRVNYVIPETVGSCTSMTDKNDKMIFEGDIIRADVQRFIVKFGKCGGVENIDGDVGYMGFYITPVNVKYAKFFRTDILFWINAYGAEVIGNIHDNPEMLSRADMPVSNDVFQPVFQPTTSENFELMHG